MQTQVVTETTLPLSGLADGTYYLCVGARNAGGTTNATNNGYAIPIDTTPPAAFAITAANATSVSWQGESGARYVLNGATIPALEALRIVSELSGVRDRVRMIPAPVARAAAAIAETAYRLRGKTPSVCRARSRSRRLGPPHG